jgi:hypothetical protein
MERKGDPPTGPRAIRRALLWALVPAVFLGLTVVWSFHRENLRIGFDRDPGEGMIGRFAATEAQAGPRGLRLLCFRFRTDSTQGASGDVVLNETRIGGIELAARGAKDFVLEVPQGVVRTGPNVLRIRSGARAGIVDDARLRDYYGQGGGLVKYLLVPRESGPARALSWILAAGIFLVLFLLAKVRPAGPMSRSLGRIHAACQISVGLLLLGAAALPFLTRYRLLLSAKNIPLFVVLLNISPISILFKKIVPKLRSDFAASALAVNPRRRLAVAIILPGLVTLFFISTMSAVKGFFGGNYSRFLRIDAGRLEEFGTLFWTPLLFENSDFEAGTLRNWQPEGNAFRGQPVRWPVPSGESEGGTGSDELGFRGIEIGGPGAGTAGTDRPAGRLASVPFIIRYGSIGFWAGGTKDESRRAGERIVLEVDGNVVLTTAPEGGGDSGRMKPYAWNVRPWIGRTARVLIVVDSAPGPPAGRFSADWFHYDRGSGIRDEVVPWGDYDGQFNYFMAYDPFLSRFKSDPRTYDLFIDEPAYRYGRIGFPLLAKAVALDNPRDYPKAMIWLIVLSHFAGAFFFLRILLFFGRHPLWTLTYLLVPGFYYSLYVGLPESLCLALCLAALSFYLRDGTLSAAAPAAAALFFRETAAILILVLAAVELFRKRRPGRAILYAGSLAPYVLWKAFVTWRLFEANGWKSLTIAPGDFAVPFAGFADLLGKIVNGTYPGSYAATSAVYAVLLTGLFAVSLYLLVKERAVLTLVFALFSLLAVSLNYGMVWLGPLNGIRLTSEAFLFGFAAVLARKKAKNPTGDRVWMAFCAIVFLFNFFLTDVSTFFRSAFIIW